MRSMAGLMPLLASMQVPLPEPGADFELLKELVGPTGAWKGWSSQLGAEALLRKTKPLGCSQAPQGSITTTLDSRKPSGPSSSKRLHLSSVPKRAETLSGTRSPQRSSTWAVGLAFMFAPCARVE